MKKIKFFKNRNLFVKWRLRRAPFLIFFQSFEKVDFFYRDAGGILDAGVILDAAGVLNARGFLKMR